MGLKDGPAQAGTVTCSGSPRGSVRGYLDPNQEGELTMEGSASTRETPGRGPAFADPETSPSMPGSGRTCRRTGTVPKRSNCSLSGPPIQVLRPATVKAGRSTMRYGTTMADPFHGWGIGDVHRRNFTAARDYEPTGWAGWVAMPGLNRRRIGTPSQRTAAESVSDASISPAELAPGNRRGRVLPETTYIYPPPAS